ncbi:rod shape-determining protein [Desulforhabdus sp. TSK]|uniref:rod shape-determining protein n=1 Tax=Desulforhabdus sp. TSK TaxID=2925014 RepID=UPI001FC8D6F4|nr:rod shape-determining protein [Desulforhabdus sp. TSK]GKT10045.1 rod shape-determining protein [Desulforhabdus sp. TSK]
MIGRMFDFLSKDMAMDLGTANTLIYVRGKGVVLDEPSMVCVDKETQRVVAVGKEAKNLSGRHGKNTMSVRPLKDGVIHDFETAAHMIRTFLGKVFKRVPLSRPKLVIAVPAGITSVEKRAVMEASEMAGAGKVYLIEEPMAAAIGSGLPIDKPMGQMVVDIGGGTTEVAIISGFAVSCSESLRVAGDEANEAICNHIRRQHRLNISESMAEIIKIKIGAAVPLKKPLEVKLRGKDLASSMPKVVTITDSDIREAIKEPTLAIVEGVRRVLEKASPDLASDVAENGIWLAGGGALLKGLRLLVHQATGLNVQKSEDPLRAVIRGAGAVTEQFDFYRDVFLN